MAYNTRVPTMTGFFDQRPYGYGSAKDWNKNGGWNTNRFRQASTTALGQESGFGLDAERQGYQDYRDFDPSQAFQGYADATLHQTGNALSDELDRLAGRGVAAGRLKTGFLDRDQGDTVRRFYSDAQDQIDRAAMQTTGMRQQQLAGLMDFGAQARNRYLDLLSGNFDRLTGEQNAKGGGFLGALGSIGGGLLGSALGPMGAAVGSKAGGWLANRL